MKGLASGSVAIKVARSLVVEDVVAPIDRLRSYSHHWKPTDRSTRAGDDEVGISEARRMDRDRATGR